MAEKAILIDVAKCTGCRACQVACKQWNQLSAQQTKNRGTYENPPDLSAHTWNRIKFNEVVEEGGLKWLFFSDRCRHCEYPPCKDAADEVIPGAIIKDEMGAVIFTEKTKKLNFADIRDACPFDIPRYDKASGRIYKCTLCIDRIKNGLKPACVKACPTGALNFGDKAEMLKLADKRIKELGGEGEASLYPGDEYNILWVLPETEESYDIAKAPKALPGKISLANLFNPWRFLVMASAFLGFVASRLDRRKSATEGGK
jgi:formate dehydrogenase iron-sulfur subunit